MSNLTDVRINIMDPYGVLYFEVVTVLPGTLVPQTAYIIGSIYYVDGIQTNLKISDDKINSLLAVSGATVDSVTLLGLKFCRKTLLRELEIAKTASGADSEDYQDILSMYKAYNTEIKDLESTIVETTAVKSSRYQQFATPSWVSET